MELLASNDGRFFPAQGGPWSACFCGMPRSFWFLPTGAIFERLGSRFGGAVLRTAPNISPARPSRSVYPGGLLKAFGAGVRAFLRRAPSRPGRLKHYGSYSIRLSSGWGLPMQTVAALPRFGPRPGAGGLLSHGPRVWRSVWLPG